MSSLWETSLVSQIVLLWPPRGQLKLSAAPQFYFSHHCLPRAPLSSKSDRLDSKQTWEVGKVPQAGGIGCGLASDVSLTEPGKVSHGSMPAMLGVAFHLLMSLLSCQVLDVVIFPFLKQEKVNSLRKGDISLYLASGHCRPHGALLPWGPMRAGGEPCSVLPSAAGWHRCVQAPGWASHLLNNSNTAAGSTAGRENGARRK